MKVYLDGLPKSASPVRVPFEKGFDAMKAAAEGKMAKYKWDEAIAKFNEAMRKAKATELVALYNLIGICYYTSGRLNDALVNYEESLKLAKKFNNKQGEAANLGNIGLIYKTWGELDKALKYHEEALKLDREIGNKKGVARHLHNIGEIHRIRGEPDKALDYYNQALELFKKIGARREIELLEENIKALTSGR